MHKIFRDTLMKKDPDSPGQKKFDKQSLTFFVSFILAIIFGFANLITSYVSGIVNNPTADNVFNSFMFLVAALSGANIANKYVDIVRARNQKEDYNQYNDNEPRRDTY